MQKGIIKHITLVIFKVQYMRLTRHSLLSQVSFFPTWLTNYFVTLTAPNKLAD